MEPIAEEVEGKQGEIATVIAQARQLKIVDAVTYGQMAEASLILRKAVKYFEDLYRPRIRQADEVVKSLRDDMRRLQHPALEAQKLCDSALVTWDNEQRRIAEQERIRLQEIQRKREEDERIELAALAEKAGMTDTAKDILETPIEQPPVTVQPNVPKVTGFSFRDDWGWELEDADKIPDEFWQLDEAKIGKIVRALKETTNIPGIRVYSKRVPVGRG